MPNSVNFANELRPVNSRTHIPDWLLGLLLALLTVAVFWPATGDDFINYDDNLYVTENIHVQSGLTWENIKWAFTNPVADNWHPLTVLSHMLVCQFFGLKPWAHHLTNVLIHAANAWLLFALLRRMTGATWRSLLVATLFAVHPLRIQSVVWVSERKDVLSVFFGLLTLIFYVRHVEQFKIQNSKFKIYYGLALLFFVCGLMSKPMVITLPFVMLLLDYWPLKRILNGESPITNFGKLLLEKIPFLLLAALVAIVTFYVQKHGGSLGVGGIFPFDVRCENALISYCRQLGKLFWPTNLAIIYPHPGHWPLTEVLLAGCLLACVTTIFIWKRRQYPFLIVGWLWFCGTLLPVIGLVQTGLQAMADRHTYLPSVGIFLLVVWGVHEFIGRWRHRLVTLSLLGSAAVVFYAADTRNQLGYWQDSEKVFRHALAVTDDNYIAHGNLGETLAAKGQTLEAIHEFQEAVRLCPAYPEAHNNLGIAFGGLGRIPEAIREFRTAIEIKTNYEEAQYNLGVALGKMGEFDEAIIHYQAAIRLEPMNAEAQNNLGIAFASKGQLDEAVRHFQAAIRIKPDFLDAQKNLARARDIQNTPKVR
jgi:Flp pilus assembly protein TadD